MTLPERFAGLRLYGDIPVPCVQQMNGDVPDFRKLDPALQRSCVDKHLCHVCGRRLDYWLWFIGGPGSVAQRAFRDGPMHEECARWAFANCPYLVTDAFKDPAVDRIALYVTRTFRYDGKLFRVAPAKRIEWRIMETSTRS